MLSDLAALLSETWLQLFLIVIIGFNVTLAIGVRVDTPEMLRTYKYDSMNAFLIYSMICLTISVFSVSMKRPVPFLLAVSGLIFWVLHTHLATLVTLRNKITKSIVIAYNTLLSVAIAYHQFDLVSLKKAIDIEFGITDNVSLTLGDAIFSIYIYLSIFVLLYYYILIYLARRKKINEDVLDQAGFDADSLDRLAWIPPAGIALIAAFATAGADVPSLTIFAGFIGASIGFATKDIITNIAAGYYLLWSDTFKRGDVISFDDGGYGVILRITSRSTVIRNRDDIHVIIPNTTLLSSTIENWTHDRDLVRLKLDIGVSYDSEIEDAERCILRAAYNSGDRVLRDPPPKVLVLGAGDSAINMQLRFWIKDADKGIRNISSVVYKEIINQLKAGGVEIPFPQMDVMIKDQKFSKDKEKIS